MSESFSAAVDIQPLPAGAIELTDKDAGRFLISFGLSGVEPQGRWTEGSEASVMFVLPDDVDGDVILKIEASAFVHDEKLPEQLVIVRVNGADAITWRLTDELFRTRVVLVGREFIDESKLLRIEFELPNCTAPAALNITADHRRLGIKLRRLAWQAVKTTPGPECWIWQLGRPVGGESRKSFDQKVETGFWRRFITGPKVLDIGFRGYEEVKGVVPISPGAIGVDLNYPGYDGRTLPFEDESQDAVYSSHCLEHIVDYAHTIRDWLRVTKFGGHIITVVPHAYIYEKRRHPPSKWNDDHKRFYTPESLLAEFEEALPPNSYRVRYLEDNDSDYRYQDDASAPPRGCYEIVLVVEKIRPPPWTIPADTAPRDRVVAGFDQQQSATAPGNGDPTESLLERCLRLPRLNRAAAPPPIPCKVCGSAATFFDAVDFNKCAAFYPFGLAGVAVPYYRCDDCGLLFTPFCDDWSHDDFARFINNDDNIPQDPDPVAGRPQLMAQRLAGFTKARILEYGASQGAFPQRMAELGFSRVTSYDPFSMPKRPRGYFDIVTCFEVIERSRSPRAMLDDMLSFLRPDGCILLGETLQPPDIDRVRCNWGHVAPRDGHVSTFADRTLVTLAEQSGLVFHRGDNLHAFLQGSGGEFGELAERFGKALACFRLGAPGVARPGAWNGLDRHRSGAFQWTAAETLTWRVICPPGTPRMVQIMVPFVHECRPGFAAACRIQIDGQTAPSSVRESCVFAEFDMRARGEITVTLRTPSLQTGKDGRRLGLGIRVAGPA